MAVEDALYRYLKSYKVAPDWIKLLVSWPVYVIPRPVLLGREYSRITELSRLYEFVERINIEEYQLLKLQSILKDAYTHIPAYRSKWDAAGIKPGMIKDLSDFKKYIPFTTREEVQNNTEAFVSGKYKPSLRLKINTGGSTGNPLTLYYLKGYSRPAEHAHMHILWSRIKYRNGDRMARLRGDYFGKDQISSFDPWRNTLLLSSFRLNAYNALHYINLLIKYKIKFINAYPSSLYSLVQYTDQKSYLFPDLIGIFLGSENIYDWQLKKFREFFNTDKIYYWYGHGELCALGGICESSPSYHFLPTYSYVEFCEQPSIETKNDTGQKLYEIVGTSFINPVMPLIRYKTQDLGMGPSEHCSGCGRNHRIMDRIIGREQEIVIGQNGEKITLTALVFGRHQEYFNHINKMQVINTKPGLLTIKIVPKSTFSASHEKEIIRSLSHLEGMPFTTVVEKVQEILPTERGKHKFLIREF